jgi:hypothetical protein
VRLNRKLKSEKTREKKIIGLGGCCTVGCKKKTGNENFPNVNLVLSIYQLIIYLTIPIK